MIILKKIWAFLKTHWYIPVVIVLLILLRNKGTNLQKILNLQRESYDKQIEEINKSYEKQKEKEKEINEEYEAAVKKIEEEYKKNNDALNAASKKQVKKLVKKYYNEPSDLALLISDRFGVTYVPKKNNSDSD